MPNHTYKIVEIVGSSPNGTDEAIRNAIAEASKTLRHLDWFEVVETRGHLVDGKVGHFQVRLKVGFRLERLRPRPVWAVVIPGAGIGVASSPRIGCCGSGSQPGSFASR